jgi:MGT family glycosyltransferase
MAKYVFVNVPAYGHVNPTLEVIQELVKRGEEVVYFLTEEFREAVEAVGATLCPYRPFGDGGFEGPLEILERVRALQPDYIVYDAMHMWARTIAEILQVPAILSCPSFVATEQFNPLKDHFDFLGEKLAAPTQIPEGFMELVQSVITSVRKKFNLGTFDMRDFYAHAEQLNIVYMPREFQPKNELFDERYAFVGPSLLKRAEDLEGEKNAKKRTLYISLGTIYNKRPAFFKQCFAAFSEGTWEVVVALGKQEGVVQQQAEKVADNFHIETFVDQSKVFPRTGVFVTHGGMNSVMESLYMECRWS